MVTQSGSTRRPTCPSCSKPTSICLCNRLRAPALHNSVTVTILQHSLEKKHPLNSTRIATIGLKNVDVITVSDVNFEARFFIRLLNSACRTDGVKCDEDSHLFDEMPSEGESTEFVGRAISGNRESGRGCMGLDGEIIARTDFNEADKKGKNVGTLSGKTGFLMDNGLYSELESSSGKVGMGSSISNEAMLAEKGEEIVAGQFMDAGFEGEELALIDSEGTAISFTIGKYGSISYFSNRWMTPDECQNMSFDQLLGSDIAVDDVRKGFVVKKLQTRLMEGSIEHEESEEFEIAIPPGSVLLFPSERSVDVEDVNFEVMNLIVLDGTWAKAKRMYNENPWLRFLPHIRLDVDKLSLYSEVRHQPRAGYLSTIESIVYAMKAIGEDSEGLDGLLDVFESMIGDQRRCKDERLSKAS
ncbi:UNVERIFIED_CONTAM: hypothetical protein Sangu_0944500 [Sesamum angustifolium]|uniref:tRNA-uridine aminocarboxypropyltransferase n=1 Tax=Sesamum angustifolium TaxID=2727405 RepID=A0AAW2PCK6_9LAMI